MDAVLSECTVPTSVIKHIKGDLVINGLSDGFMTRVMDDLETLRQGLSFTWLENLERERGSLFANLFIRASWYPQVESLVLAQTYSDLEDIKKGRPFTLKVLNDVKSNHKIFLWTVYLMASVPKEVFKKIMSYILTSAEVTAFMKWL